MSEVQLLHTYVVIFWDFEQENVCFSYPSPRPSYGLMLTPNKHLPYELVLCFDITNTLGTTLMLHEDF